MKKTPRGPYYAQDPQWFDARRDRIVQSRREGQTLKAIGETWGITGGRVRQIVVEEFKRRRNRGENTAKGVGNGTVEGRVD